MQTNHLCAVAALRHDAPCAQAKRTPMATRPWDRDDRIVRRETRPPRSTRGGTSLIETMVVLTIISILMALLMPALHQAREAARRAVCENNLHQMGIAMHSSISANRKFPAKAKTGQAGGWSVVILEFLEQRNLQLAIEKNPSLTASPLSSYLAQRPMIMSCPLGDSSDSSTATVPVGNYILGIDLERNYWKIGDSPLGFTGPWVNGPEFGLDGWDNQKGPHYGGFYICNSDGSVDFVEGGAK